MNRAYTLCMNTILQFEESFIELIFKLSNNKDVTSRKIRQYIRYIADRRLMQIGLKEIYVINENPLPCLDGILIKNMQY